MPNPPPTPNLLEKHHSLCSAVGPGSELGSSMSLCPVFGGSGTTAEVPTREGANVFPVSGLSRSLVPVVPGPQRLQTLRGSIFIQVLGSPAPWVGPGYRKFQLFRQSLCCVSKSMYFQLPVCPGPQWLQALDALALERVHAQLGPCVRMSWCAQVQQFPALCSRFKLLEWTICNKSCLCPADSLVVLVLGCLGATVQRPHQIEFLFKNIIVHCIVHCLYQPSCQNAGFYCNSKLQASNIALKGTVSRDLGIFKWMYIEEEHRFDINL